MASVDTGSRAKVELERIALSAADILADYETAVLSREASLVGHREVMSGKAKFGIFGDGKEIPQVAMARAWRPGDIRAGYYRDQTLMFALGMSDVAAFFAQLYAHADVEAEPASAGRQMNCHFATRSLTPDGEWKDLLADFNSSADLSPTGSQMPRLVGLAYASRLYRELEDLAAVKGFSWGGAEVAWGLIGNATCAEGMFWEAVNAVGVLGGPMVLSIWDDGYGISVPNAIQIAKTDLSAVLAGFQREPGGAGYEIRTVKGWDYAALADVYAEAAELARSDHVPTIVHVTELTQPLGHSTSGSHERYKSPARLEWEKEWDGLRQMRRWIIAQGVAQPEELDDLEARCHEGVEAARAEEWARFIADLEEDRGRAVAAIEAVMGEVADGDELRSLVEELSGQSIPLRRHSAQAMRRALMVTRHASGPARQALAGLWAAEAEQSTERYAAHLYSEAPTAVSGVSPVAPEYDENPPRPMGFEIVNACFDAMLARDPRVIAFGEDVGRIGDVNQGFRGLQEKYGPLRVSDTGIREATIIGQAIGMAMRGLRPIAEVQYLDYLLYAIQIMSDDLATLRWRTAGGQAAPVIVRTRGHRLEGVWHSGSLVAGIINLVRGMHVLVPRDMTRAAGFYNTLLEADEPALVVEVLNGYRIREAMPTNIDKVKVQVGVPEVLRSGDDVTVVTYGACCRIALAAAERLAGVGIDTEVIDVQSLLPFDRPGLIGRSLEKTGRILFVDEDVPGGTTAYMLRQVMEAQHGYWSLDSEPRTLSGTEHRPAYGSDGDYFSKPSVEDVAEAVYHIMSEVDPREYPPLVE